MVYQTTFDPAKNEIERLAALDPTNPFWTANYVRARREMGAQPFLLAIGDGAAIAVGCTAFLENGRLSRRVEIPSIPATADPLFWSGLVSTCRRLRATALTLQSFGSHRNLIPRMPGEVSRKLRTEHIVVPEADNPTVAYSKNHMRNVFRARRAGVTVRRAVNDGGCCVHALLEEQTILRREPGRRVTGCEERLASYRSLVGSGAAEVYQAILADQVVASVLVLVASRGFYYHSAGANECAREVGAAHLIVDALIQEVRNRDMDVLNLGGTSETMAGLSRFKSGFGATPIALECVECWMGSRLVRRITRLLARTGAPR